MSDAALRTLESLRRDAVEAARQRLAQARVFVAQCEERLKEGLAANIACEASLRNAALDFAAASSVSKLRCAEERLRGVRCELEASVARTDRLQAALSHARRQLAEETTRFADAERGRRALGHLLETRREAAEKRRERAEEEQADDVLRARRVEGSFRAP